ncbi:YIPF1 protein [Phytophthora cinnamomi]|uniref:YIPF1 protein n=1 Tax=Phytophthora cinnamomi TaxID=4785 RepID=UPI00355AA813|nr:YIPF1 protein [Phytophthora cinnamomi]
MDDDVKSAANAMNDRGADLNFEVSVVEGDELEDGLMSPKVRDTLMGSKKTPYGEEDKPARPVGLCGCLSLAYYQPYFDVDTTDVQQRLLRALVPFKKDPTFAELALQSPDAYGPFWLSTTLIFCLASCSNAASFLDYEGNTDEWAYDFSRLASAYTLVEIFLLGLPMLIWLVGKYFQVPMTLLFLVCLYGYSSIMFIPAAILCVSPIDAMDWVVMLMAMAWSLYFLLNNLWHVISEHLTKEKMLPVLAVISGAHMTWAILMKLLFF